MRDYEIVQVGPSRSFLSGDPFLQSSIPGAEVILYLGGPPAEDVTRTAILVELDTECLGVYTGEQSGCEGSNILGFARYRNGNDAPTNLIELVRQPNSNTDAIEAAILMFEASGFEVVVCADQAGRIIDRLVRPKYNAALRFLDEGLASAAAMDMTCRMGLGYPDGPIERVVRGDLARHHDVTTAIWAMNGQAAYMPARRSVVAKARKQS
ncbi:3-hydroxybutyryl-CoA dehydrogenase [Sphingobium sp. AP50]|uniref:3-hydroxyacyl-CoA dehydrogenase family protein n=1 Tax=Sphingobium sp. AP50 TaxID=1884369 RepID=UPI0008CD03AD|nr:3-hydroxyacyl-CoA dehydrogenase family protein [Sphingobium sp. AP50]SEJ66327.1 3-hydroxybutyryl-CoA dehydrogenase [Sphingobium sp. AP50]